MDKDCSPINNIYQSSKSAVQNIIEDNPKASDELSLLIKEIPLNNLNDYYDIETNLFKKRIEKLNLKFYWIYESILAEETNNKLLYPFNKLFLILFKEISLYIEEIIRLNKQLNSKTKNEKFYIQKINDYKEKDKDFLFNKQMVKSLQRSIKNLEKNNEKLKNEMQKLNKKAYNINSPKINYNNQYGSFKSSKLSKFSKTSNKFFTENSTHLITEQGSVMSSGSNKFSNKTFVNKKYDSKGNINTNRINSNSSIYTKTTNISSGNSNKEMIFISINQCVDEINNLNLIENLLKSYYEKKTKYSNKGKNSSFKRFTPEKYDTNNNNQVTYSTYKKNLNNFKKNTKYNKSIDFKTSINKF